MIRNPIFESDYKPKFTGHETFPLRYGWLNKVCDSITKAKTKKDHEQLFNGESAIAQYGVGKNMVSAMRHWGLSTEIIEHDANSRRYKLTELGSSIFGDNGFDCFMEHPTTLWLLHWKIVTNTKLTSWHWIFNYFPEFSFESNELVNGLRSLVLERNWKKVAETTIRNDVNCFVRSYSANYSQNRKIEDDSFESPFTELGLIKSTNRGKYRFVRGPKQTVGNGLFVFALLEFWENFSKSSSLSFEAVAYEPGGPGKVFQMSESEIEIRLSNIEEITGGALRWSETAGLRQVTVNQKVKLKKSFEYVKSDYKVSN